MAAVHDLQGQWFKMLDTKPQTLNIIDAVSML